jgi:hypothetical protein
LQKYQLPEMRLCTITVVYIHARAVLMSTSGLNVCPYMLLQSSAAPDELRTAFCNRLRCTTEQWSGDKLMTLNARIKQQLAGAPRCMPWASLSSILRRATAVLPKVAAAYKSQFLLVRPPQAFLLAYSFKRLVTCEESIAQQKVGNKYRQHGSCLVKCHLLKTQCQHTCTTCAGHQHGTCCSCL